MAGIVPFGMVPTTTEGAALNAIPADYQDQLQRAALKQKLAQVLLAQGQQTNPGRMIGNTFVAPGKLDAVAPLLSTLAGVLASRRADSAQSDVQSAYQTERNSDMQAVTGMLQGKPGTINGDGTVTPDQGPDTAGAIARASQSRIPEVQALAKALRDSQDKRALEAMKSASPESQAAYARSGNVADLQPGRISDPTTLMGDDGKPIGTYITDPKGQPHFVPKGVNVTTNVGQKVGSDILKMQVEGLSKALPDVQKAALNIPKLSDLYDFASNAPTNNGAFADQKTAIQKLGQLVGLDVPLEAANSEFYTSQVQPLIGAALRSTTGAQQVSDSDRKAAEKSLPSLALDPRAMRSVAATLLKSTIGTVDQHNRQLQTIKEKSPAMEDFNPNQLDPYFVPWSANGSSPAVQDLYERIATGKSLAPAAVGVGQDSAAPGASAPASKGKPKVFSWNQQ